MIGYSGATVPSSNHAMKDLIRFFKIPSARVLKLVFVNPSLFNTPNYFLGSFRNFVETYMEKGAHPSAAAPTGVTR